MKLVPKSHKNNCNYITSNVENLAGEIGRSSNSGDGRTVVVAVRLDQQSKQLLTWALVKVAQPGDRVLALHVLHSSPQEQSTLVALVKTFDSVLAVYEGFCHLKQVDLKLKVCRGSSLRKILVREAKEFESAIVILGVCKIPHSIRSPTSVAKYCAKKLSNKFSVYAVDNGKVIFHKEAATSCSGNVTSYQLNDRVEFDNIEQMGGDWNSAIVPVEPDMDKCDSFEKLGVIARKSTLIKRYLGCAPISLWADYPCDDLEEEESHVNVVEDTSLALVPYQKPEASPGQNLTMDQEAHGLSTGWPLLRRAFLPKHPEADRVPSRKTSMVRRVLKFPRRHSSMAVHPDRKRHNSVQLDNQLADLSTAIIPVDDVSASAPCSPSHRFLPKEWEDLLEKYSTTCRLFTYQELLSATSDFIPENVVGKGGSSQVYRGCLPDGKEIAVKILKPSEDVLQEFIAEIEIITTINHKNIISICGFCLEDEYLILVYDFLPKGSLEENLHGDKSDVNLFGWEERYKVAVGVAEALDCLHNRDSDSVIHRDVKSSNILLSDEYEPQLADFGLATRVSIVSSHFVSTDVAGTFGYLAPEYFMHGKVTDKVDIYAFGVVLLELLSGRKPIDSSQPKGKESLVMWANLILKEEKQSHLLDPRLDSSDHDHERIERMVLAATLCIRREPQLRPRIGNVLKLLQGDIEVINWAKQHLNKYPVDFDALDVETSPIDIQSHLNLALLGIEADDSASVSSTEPNISLEDYLNGRWSRSSSFD
ncbi:protein kinase STUNTED-like [Silene latifolia]|uniref:protein kinase STUNTED-like n=1 Tax=Silene latifolia TaxID=37657 RepID=UPI003D76BF0C